MEQTGESDNTSNSNSNNIEASEDGSAGPSMEKQRADSKLALARTGVPCQLCNLICSGRDSYIAHIRGTKHQRVINKCFLLLNSLLDLFVYTIVVV
mgnify:CR=1 FL=1